MLWLCAWCGVRTVTSSEAVVRAQFGYPICPEIVTFIRKWSQGVGQVSPYDIVVLAIWLWLASIRLLFCCYVGG